MVKTAFAREAQRSQKVIHCTIKLCKLHTSQWNVNKLSAVNACIVQVKSECMKDTYHTNITNQRVFIHVNYKSNNILDVYQY